PRPDLTDDAGALVAEDRGEDALAVLALERVGVGMADAGRHDLDQHLARFGPVEVDLMDFERRVGRDGDRGAGLHGQLPYVRIRAAYKDSDALLKPLPSMGRGWGGVNLRGPRRRGCSPPP